MISDPVSNGIEPPTRLVLPPCGTIACPASWQSPTTAATSSVLAGRITAAALPVKRPRHSER